MFEPFRAAPTGAKIANLLILLFLFLSWVSTMVTFGSVLHRMSEYYQNVGDPNTYYAHLDFYWDHWTLSSSESASPTASDKYSQQQRRTVKHTAASH